MVVLGMSAGGGRHIPQRQSAPGVSPWKIFEILDADSCFPVHFQPEN